MQEDFINEEDLLSKDEVAKLLKMSFWDKLRYKLFPKSLIKIANKNRGIDDKPLYKIHEALQDVERIDIFPLVPDDRGFMLVLDRNKAFFFYQDGDHFQYDGFETGEYDKGDVTIFEK